ncbi:MAG: hypothetical protein DRJ64_08085, partial [Thermoprotei archaeon]
LIDVHPVIVSPFNPAGSLTLQLLVWEFGEPLRRHLPVLLWAMPDLVGHPALGNLGITKSEFEPTAEALDAHLVALLEEISEIKPLLIMFEDGTDQQFISKLARRGDLGNILFVAKNFDPKATDIRTKISELAPLSFGNIISWINSVLGTVEGLNDLVQHIHRVSEGYPKKIDLTLRELIARGYLYQTAEKWRFSLAKPQEIQALVPEEKLKSALKIIAVSPEGVPYSVLVDILGEEWAPLVASELIASGQIDEIEKHNCLVYVLTRPSIAEKILPKKKEKLDYLTKQVAESLKKLKIPEFSFLSAKLLIQIGEFESALKTLRSIAKPVRMQYNFPLLFKIYDLSLTCAEKLGDEELIFRIMKRKAFALTQANRFEDAIAVNRQILSFLKKYPDIEKETAILIDLGGLLMKVGKFDEALSHLDEALEYSRQLGDERLELFALTNIAAVIQSKGDYTEAANIYWQARSIANQIQNYAALATIETNLGLILLAQQKYTQSLDRFLSAISVSDTDGLLIQKFSALIGLSIVYRRLGNLDLAARTVKELRELGITPFYRLETRTEEIFLSLYRGDEIDIHGELTEILTDLKSLARSSYNEVVKSILPALVLIGVPISDILETIPLPPEEKLSSKLWESLVAFESGQYGTAAESAEELLEQIKYPGSHAEMWCAAAQILTSSLPPSDAAQKLEKLLQKPPEDPFVQGYLWQKLAEIYAEKVPDPQKGQKALNRAKEFFSRLNNQAKLKELEHIADYLRGSRYGGDAGLLLEVAKAFTSTLEWEELVKVVLDRAIEVSGATRALLITPTEDGEFVPIAGRTESRQDLSPEQIKFSTTAVRKAVESKKSLLIESVPEDEELSARQSVIELKILMVLAVPLICRGELMGVLYADAEMRRSVFSERTVRLLETLGEFAAMALYNAKLFGQIIAERDALRAQTREFLGENFVGGKAPSIRQLIPKIAAVASQDVTVLLLGETGTGKDLIARIIHSKSPRADKPFIVLNCAAVPESLLEAELFGYEKGAFTGATRRQLG